MVPENNTFAKVKEAEDKKIRDRPKLKFDRVSGCKNYNLVRVKGAETMVFAQIVKYKLMKNANIRQLVPTRIPAKDEEWWRKSIAGKLEALPEGTKSVAYLVFNQVSPETGYHHTIKSFSIDNTVKEIIQIKKDSYTSECKRTLFAD